MANQGEPAPIGFEMQAAVVGQNGEFGFCNISVVQYLQVGRTSNSFSHDLRLRRRGVGHYIMIIYTLSVSGYIATFVPLLAFARSLLVCFVDVNTC